LEVRVVRRRSRGAERLGREERNKVPSCLQIRWLATPHCSRFLRLATKERTGDAHHLGCFFKGRTVVRKGFDLKVTMTKEEPAKEGALTVKGVVTCFCMDWDSVQRLVPLNHAHTCIDPDEFSRGEGMFVIIDKLAFLRR
jgi:hypothetical protein